MSHRFHRFWTCSVFGKNRHADFTDDADFFDLCGRGSRRFFLLEICVLQISQINTDFLFGYLGGILLPIMARMNLCKSVESVGLFNGEFYQLNRLNPVGKFRLLPALRNLSWR